MRIEARIAAAAAANPGAIALEGTAGERLRYADLARAAGSAAGALAASGVGAGSRVALVFENDVCVPVVLLAILHCGGCAVPLNARLADAELDAVLAHADPSIVLFFERDAGAATQHARRLGALRGALAGLPTLSVLARHPLDNAPLPEEVALLLYTSGSTGAPKGVMLTHANLDFLLEAGLAQHWLRPDDRVLAVLPMSHSFGLTSVALSALAGGACLLPRPAFDAGAVLQSIATREVTAFLGVPAMYARLAEHVRASGRSARPNALRLAYVGGAPLEAALKREYEDLLGLALCSGYGLTEAAPTVTRTLAGEARGDVSAGRPIPGVELRIRDPETLADRPPGEVGLAFVRGPNVMLGYYKDAAASAAAIDARGWLDTGDLARMDEEGRVFIVGRRKELIIRSGFNVYPQEVEQAIASHPAVTAVAVLGRARAGNEEVMAFVVLRPGASLDAAALRLHLAPQLSAYKIPSEFVLRDALPLLVNGKVDKAALRREFAANL